MPSPTSPDTLSVLLARTAAVMLDGMADLVDSPMIVALMRSGRLLADVTIPSVTDVERIDALLALRLLARSVSADAIGVVLDVWVGTDPTQDPSEDPNANNALLALGILPEAQVSRILYYTVGDDGVAALDVETTVARTQQLRLVEQWSLEGQVIETLAPAIRAPELLERLVPMDAARRLVDLGAIVAIDRACE